MKESSGSYKAAIKKQHYLETYSVNVGLFTGWSKWLNTSLFAVNGAGLVAVGQRADKFVEIQSPAWPFTIGLILALLASAVLQEYYLRSIPILQMFRNYWFAVDGGKPRNVRVERNLQKKYDRLDCFRCLAPVLGWLSGTCFIIGILCFVSGL